MSDYMAQDLNGKLVSLETVLGAVPGGELMFCNRCVEGILSRSNENLSQTEKKRELNIHIMVEGKAGMDEFLVPLVLNGDNEDDRKLCTLLEQHNSK